jgi:hypothetical protein
LGFWIQTEWDERFSHIHFRWFRGGHCLGITTRRPNSAAKARATLASGEYSPGDTGEASSLISSISALLRSLNLPERTAPLVFSLGRTARKSARVLLAMRSLSMAAATARLGHVADFLLGNSFAVHPMALANPTPSPASRPRETMTFQQAWSCFSGQARPRLRRKSR